MMLDPKRIEDITIERNVVLCIVEESVLSQVLLMFFPVGYHLLVNRVPPNRCSNLIIDISRFIEHAKTPNTNIGHEIIDSINDPVVPRSSTTS